MKEQRIYDKEFRLNAIKHHQSSEKSVAQVAKDLGVPPSTLYGWIKEYKEHGEESFPGSGNIKPVNQDYYKLLKEYENVKMERDILKKAVAIFSKAKK